MNDVRPSQDEAWHHATSTVEPGAHVAVGVRIWHYSHVRSGAVIGAGTQLGMSVYIDDGAVLGECVKVQNHVSIYRGVVLEDEVFVGPSALFTNDRRPRATGAWTLDKTIVRRGASIGAGAVILSDIEIGAHAMVAAGAVVTRDVPPHALVVGNPARLAGWVCRCGQVVSRDTTEPSTTWCGQCPPGHGGSA